MLSRYKHNATNIRELLQLYTLTLNGLAIIEMSEYKFKLNVVKYIDLAKLSGWSDGVKVLGKFSVPGRPTNLDYSRARTYCACSRCGLFGHFSLVFLPLSGICCCFVVLRPR